MVNEALANRPDIHAAQAQIRAAQAAVRLAKGDRIPTPVIGPQYAMDEAGIQYVGLIYVTPVPLLNGGKPLVVQREAEARRACVALQQAEQRAVAQVRAAVGEVERGDGAGQRHGRPRRRARGRGGEARAALRRGSDRPDEAHAGPPAADPARELAARRRSGRRRRRRPTCSWPSARPTLINGMLARAEADAGVPVQAPPAATPPPPPPPSTPPVAPTRAVASARASARPAQGLSPRGVKPSERAATSPPRHSTDVRKSSASSRGARTSRV